MQELGVEGLITVDEAARRIDAAGAGVLPRAERVPLRQAAGRVLLEPILADRAYPPFDKALMDGFAARSVDGDAPRRIIGEVAAGETFGRAIEVQEAVAIMTGAPVPLGADTLVPIERSTHDPSGAVRFDAAPAAGANIARRGGEIDSGAIVLAPGTALGPAQILAAATVGASEVTVSVRPRVCVISTGNELLPPDAPSVGAAQIRDANGPMLEVLLTRLGCEVCQVERVGDDPPTMRQCLQRAAAACDILIVSGGASMGRYDHVPALLAELGFAPRITKLRIRPGKPFVFGVRDQSSEGARFAFGLPGNPLSAFACTLRLIRPLIQALQGVSTRLRWVQGVLGEPLTSSNGPREFYQPARWDGEKVFPLTWRGSGDVFTLAGANVLLRRVENEPPQAVGSSAMLLEIP